MPVSFNSPPRNFFLLGSGGEDAVTNFFHNINRSTSSDNRYTTGDIRYSEVDQKYLLSGNGRDSNSIHFGFVEKQAYDAETDPANPTNVQDWRTKFNQTVTNGTGCRINFMKQQQPYGGLIYVGGKTNGMPWISQVNSNGTQVWSSTSSTADLEYFDVAIKSNGTASEDQIYACGHKYIALTGEWVAFIEKWDGDGNPLWGKASTRLGGDVNLWSIAANDRDQVVAVGSIDGVEEQGYVVKVDANTGEVLWDLTIDSGEEHQAGSKNPVELKDVYIDGKDQIYIVGAESDYDSGVINNGIIFKYTAEGNLIWQKRSPVGEEHTYYKVWSDTEVEQTIVLSHEVVAGSPTKRGPTLIKYSKNGDVVFKRRIQSSTNFAEGNNVFDEGVMGLEGDPSFYYILFVDEQENVGTGASKTYNFGKVSASGNGFGEFTYDATNSKTITYSVNSAVDRIGRLSDGSVRNDTSDQISYPYNGLKTLFDDYATNIAYKKTRHEEKDVFLYSGSPSVRPVDFSQVDLTTETTSVTVGGTTTVYAKDKGIAGSSWKLVPVGGSTPVKGAANSEHEWLFLGNAYNGFQTSNVAALGTSDFSFEVWFKTPGQSAGGVWQYLFSNKDDFDGPFTRLGFHVNDGTLRFYTEEPGGTKLLVYGNTDCYDDNWHHAVFTRTGGVGTVYLDGDSDGTGPVMSTDIGNATNDWYIGYNGNPTNGNGYFKGSMSDFRYYPRCLSEEEVYQNFHATKYKYKDQLPHTAAKISTNTVTDTTLILHYDFGNRVCYEPAENLIPWSTHNGNWNTGSNGALVENAGIAPDGTMTATKATISSNDIDTSPSLGPVTAGASTQIPITGGKEYTFSCWVKASTPDQVGNNFKVRWKRITGDAISAETTFALEKNWKRYHCTARTKSNNTTMICNVGGVDGSEALVWGAQLEEGGNMNNYFQTYGEAKTARSKPKNIVFQGSGLGQPTGCSFTDSANPSALRIGSNFTMPVSVSGSIATVTHAHNLTTGDSVSIKLQLENPSMVIYNYDMNVYYTVTVVDANTFTYDLGSSTHTGYSGRAFYYDPNAGVPCWDFDGSGVNTSFIDTGVNAGSVSSLTVECWMKVDTYSNSGAGITIGDLGTTRSCYLGVGTSGGNSIDWRFYLDPYQEECEHFTQTNNWQHLVGTYDQDAGYGTMRLYINDVEQDTAINTGNTSAIDFSSGRNIMLGTNTYNSNVGTGDLDGQIAEVRVYKRRLSVGEISQNFNATRSKYGV